MKRSCRETVRASCIVMRPALRELAPRAAEPGGAGDPEHGLQVAQAARALLDVGLEVVRRVVVLEVPLLLLERLRLVEVPRRPSPRRTSRAKRRKSGREPATSRCSSRLVRIVMSPAISVSHSAIVRTLWPTSRPMSHSIADEALDERACRRRRARAGSRIRTSTSECGKSWPRP